VNGSTLVTERRFRVAISSVIADCPLTIASTPVGFAAPEGDCIGEPEQKWPVGPLRRRFAFTQPRPGG